MIISRIFGGLGNQLFQYAIGRSLALRHQTEFKIDISGYRNDPLRAYELQAFYIQASIATQSDVTVLRGKKPHRVESVIRRIMNRQTHQLPASYILEPSLTFQPSVLKLSDNIYLDGYWQSEKYFIDSANTLRQDLKWKNSPNKDNFEMLEKIHSTGSVAIHVRRGDYIQNPKTNSFHGTTPIEYYQLAVLRVLQQEPNPMLFIFSDDNAWVRKNLTFAQPTIYVECNDAAHAADDLRLVTACRHHIIANSTFSWWGAWLGEKPNQIVIAPKRWFNDSTIDAADILPKRWATL